MSDPVLERYVAIGSDRYVTYTEAAIESTPHGRKVWDVYDRHFGRFTGAGLDPSFRRLRHAGRRLSLPCFEPGSTVVVVGGSPLDASRTERLLIHRDRFVVLATGAGLEWLHAHGVVADVVLVEHTEDAAWSGMHSVAPRTAWLVARAADVPNIASPGAVHVAPALPTWGVPLATAVALALDGGAATVVVTGVNGRAQTGGGSGLDLPSVTLWALLDLLALHAPGRLALFEADRPALPAQSSAWQSAWDPGAATNAAPPQVAWIDFGAAAGFVDQARTDLSRLAPILPDARQALEVALDARETGASSRELHRAVETVLAWGADPCIRWAVQQGLGLAFLPRLWRSGISMDPAARQWRPIVLALHELVEQANRLGEALDRLPADQGSRAPHSRQSAATSGQAASTRVTAIIAALDDDLSGLQDAVLSLTRQTHEDLEVLVVHGPGTRATVAEALPAGDPRVRGVEVDGATIDEALNHALAVASGDLVAPHDANGVSHPQRLARQVAYLRRHPEIDVVATTTVALDSSAAGATRLCDPRAHTPDALSRLLDAACPFVHGSVLLRRDAVLRAGGYPAPTPAAPAFDHELWRRLQPTSRFAKLPTQLYARRASLAGTALAPSRAGDWHAPAGTKGPLADPQAGRGLAALELGQAHEA